MRKELAEEFGWVLRGKQRRAIMKALGTPKTPTLIKEDTKIKISNVSDVLRAMVKRGLAKCLNPTSKLGRLYSLTKKGKEVYELL